MQYSIHTHKPLIYYLLVFKIISIIAVVCDHVSLPKGGVNYDCKLPNELFNVGNVASFWCRSGYKVDGPSSARCLPGYKWTTTPKCS